MRRARGERSASSLFVVAEATTYKTFAAGLRRKLPQSAAERRPTPHRRSGSAAALIS